MKKIVLVLMFLVTAVTSVNSQNSVVAGANLTYWKSRDYIIRQYNYPATILCFYDNLAGNTVFSYQNSSLQMQYRVLENFRVSDFVIDEDSVFFCGMGADTIGFIGFYDINDFFFGTGNYYIQNNFVFGPNDMYVAGNITRLVTYKSVTGNRHVVGIGYMRDYYSLEFGCLVDIVDDRVKGFLSYDVGYIDKSFRDCFKDIIVIGDNLVTAGYEDNTFIHLRVYDKNDVFSLTGIQDVTHIFADYSHKWILDDLLLAKQSNTIFSTASRFYSDSQHKSYDSVHLAKYTLPGLISHNTNIMISASEMASKDSPEITSLREYMYNPGKSHYALLCLGRDMGYQGEFDMSFLHVLSQDLMNSSGGIVGDFNDGFVKIPQYQSFDLFGNDRDYVFGGADTNSYRTVFGYEPTGTGSGCNSTITNIVREMNPIPNSVRDAGFQWVGRRCNFILHNASYLFVRDIEIRCDESDGATGESDNENE